MVCKLSTKSEETSAKKTVKKAAVKKTAAKKTAVKKTVAPKTAKKAAVKRTAKANKSKRKTNLLKLYSEMNKLVTDAVDREIVRRFKIIVETGDDDITKPSLNTILKDPFSIEASSYEERLQPYIRHYIFMLKRKMNKEKKDKN